MKMYLLKGHNPLGINNDSYSFGNFFSISSLSSFLEIGSGTRTWEIIKQYLGNVI